MKKKLLCLLLALVVVMSVLPLTAFASDVPEEYRGKYEGEILIGYKQHDVYLTVTVDEITISIPDCYFEKSYSNKGNSSYNIFGSDRNENIKMNFGERMDADYKTTYFNGETHLTICPLYKVSDSTGSTLSIGSNLIIPIAAAVLLIGGVIFIGKRKKEKEIQ